MNAAELTSFLTELRKRCPDLAILENEPMAKHCSFRIGGPCDAMLLPSSREEVETVCAMLDAAGEALPAQETELVPRQRVDSIQTGSSA